MSFHPFFVWDPYSELHTSCFMRAPTNQDMHGWAWWSPNVLPRVPLPAIWSSDSHARYSESRNGSAVISLSGWMRQWYAAIKARRLAPAKLHWLPN